MRENPAAIHQLKSLIQKEIFSTDFSENLSNFLQAYETVFEINLFAAKWLKKLEILLKKEPIGIADILSGSSFLEKNTVTIETQELTGFVWNTLEISDNERFYTPEKVKNDSENTIAFPPN